MKSILRAGAPALAITALAGGAMAAPAGAATHSSLARVTKDVRAANAALVRLDRNAKHPRVARKALEQTRHELTTAVKDARALHHHAGAKTTAKAARMVAVQADWDLRTFTSLLGHSSSSLQTPLAQALKTALSGRSEALGLLGGVTGGLTGSDANAASGTIAGLLGVTPTEIGSLAGLINGSQLPGSIDGILGQVLSMASGALDIGLGQLQGLVPMLPPAAQADVQALVNDLNKLFSDLQSTLQGVGGTGTGDTGSGDGSGTGTGSTLEGQFGQALSLLQSLLGNLNGMFGGVTGTDPTGTGTTGTGTTGTCPTPGTGSTGLPGLPGLGSILGNLPFIGSILGDLPGLGSGSGLPGLGSILGGLTGGTGSTGTGSTGTGSTGTCSTGTGPTGPVGLPGLPMLTGIPSFIEGLLGQFGMNLPIGLSADVG